MSSKSSLLRAWPGLGQLPDGPAPITAERGVYGKMHNARTDARWIAHSPDLDPVGRKLEDQLYVGPLEFPASAVFWRALDRPADGHLAMACKPARARDATGRSGIIERQVLQCRGQDRAPTAAVALELLPQVQGLPEGKTWWDQRTDERWEEIEHHITLEAVTARVEGEALHAAVTDGLKELGRLFGEDRARLAAIYQRLLGRGSAAPLFVELAAPLGPEALAALMLPLPSQVVDRVSIAGWVLSLRATAERLQGNWDVVFCPAGAVGLERQGAQPAPGEVAMRCAEQIIAGRPPALPTPAEEAPVLELISEVPDPSDELQEDAPPRDELPELRPIQQAVEGMDRGLPGFDHPLPLEPGRRQQAREALRACLQRLEDTTPDSSVMQKVAMKKANLIRAAAYVLAPGPTTLEEFPWPDEGFGISPLHYIRQLPREHWTALADLAGLEGLLGRPEVRQDPSLQPLSRWLAQRSWGREAEVLRPTPQAQPRAQVEPRLELEEPDQAADVAIKRINPIEQMIGALLRMSNLRQCAEAVARVSPDSPELASYIKNKNWDSSTLEDLVALLQELLKHAPRP